MKKRNKRTREKSNRGGCLKTFGIGFVALMLMSSLGGDGGNTDTTQNFATTTTDNETEELSSEVEGSIQAEESLAEEREAKEEEERLAKEKEEEERLEQESIEAAEEWQEKLDNARTDVTYDNLMRTPDDYFIEIVQLSGTVLQTIKGNGRVQQRVALYDNYDHIVLIEYNEELPETRLLDDDYIAFTGVAYGTIEYETVLGATLEIPLIYVERIELE